MTNKDSEYGELIEAVRDLSRILLAINAPSTTQADLIRKLNGLSIPASRIALLLDIPSKDVRSVLARSRKASRARNT
jgi:hypothetical protein